ncbi:thymidine phosphorylase [Enterovirga rhinocerotis]|uniref:Thymidine phosphorylase n=1 Tax=Enterovirga rhinocerotis TaxID=1339210 RepID=A0A4R7BX37_9HYPH|nr:thymidine phosphorylase [Enterovirga rhinocerotis]TDR90141.1 thymidine phosphorylase [Enterovirga rhinocerotis]
MFLPQEVIRAKRDGRALEPEEIEAFVAGLVDGGVGEGQAAALAMAICIRGLSLAECVALTGAMTRSGTVLAWDLPGPALDKHSTGGVGDGVSLVLAPAVAACGGYVPMIAGRGLGHTGGTLDKLDSIPGYVSQPDLDTFRRVVREAGCAVIGQTPDIAPADRRLYAIRDVTGTVESIDLITSSILSKKLAAGLDGLVMDVKTGSGAFLAQPEESRALAERIVAVANGAGLRTSAYLTDMAAPLASVAGNALEIRHAVDHLAGRQVEPRFQAVTVALGGAMLALGGLASDEAEGRRRIEEAFASGAAAERFGRMVSALGGPADLVERPERHLPAAPVRREIGASARGFVEAIDTRALGLAVVALGGGRVRAADPIDHAVGLVRFAGIGAEIEEDTPLAIVHAGSDDAAERAARAVRAAYSIGERPPVIPPVVGERIEAP